MILTDFDFESLKRVNKNFHYLFPKRYIEYEWRNKTYIYHFQTFPTPELSREMLNISNGELIQGHSLNGLIQDAIVILLFGSACIDPETAEKLSQCKLGSYLGQPRILNELANKKYIEFSPIVSGIKSRSFTQGNLILAEETNGK